MKRKVGLKRTSWKRSKKPKKHRDTAKDLWGQFGLEVPSYVRYKGLKGVYWWLFSRYVRIRDFKKYGGRCVDQCGGIAQQWQELQGGHFYPASKGFTLLFDERNVAGQLPACNNPAFSPLSSVGFARELDERYGKGTANELMERGKQITKEWSNVEYKEKIKELLRKTQEL